MIIRITLEYFRLNFSVFLQNLSLRSDLFNSYKKETVYQNLLPFLILFDFLIFDHLFCHFFRVLRVLCGQMQIKQRDEARNLVHIRIQYSYEPQFFYSIFFKSSASFSSWQIVRLLFINRLKQNKYKAFIIFKNICVSAF